MTDFTIKPLTDKFPAPYKHKNNNLWENYTMYILKKHSIVFCVNLYDILAAEPRRRGVKLRDIMHYKQCTFVTN